MSLDTASNAAVKLYNNILLSENKVETVAYMYRIPLKTAPLKIELVRLSRLRLRLRLHPLNT